MALNGTVTENIFLCLAVPKYSNRSNYRIYDNFVIFDSGYIILFLAITFIVYKLFVFWNFNYLISAYVLNNDIRIFEHGRYHIN